MPKLAPSVTLNNGIEMPLLGLGTLSSKDNEAVEVIKHAIASGYRHIDTALFYQNESQVGEAIRAKIADGTVKREDIFVVTKLWNVHHDPDRVEHACRLSLKNLGLDYVNLYLMHTPMASVYVSDEFDDFMPKDKDGNIRFSDVDYVDTWNAMEKLVGLGLVKSIGVSNFNSEQIQRVLDNCKVKPVTNQVECGPSINQKQLIKFCKDRGVIVTAYSPLGRPHVNLPNIPKPALADSRVAEIGDKYGKTAAQVILRFLIQLGAIPIPKSANNSRVDQNLDVFDFELTAAEMTVMETFNTGERTIPFALSTKHKYFPFNIPY